MQVDVMVLDKSDVVPVDIIQLAFRDKNLSLNIVCCDTVQQAQEKMQEGHQRQITYDAIIVPWDPDTIVDTLTELRKSCTADFLMIVNPENHPIDWETYQKITFQYMTARPKVSIISPQAGINFWRDFIGKMTTAIISNQIGTQMDDIFGQVGHQEPGR